MTNYSYPRVDITTRALSHYNPVKAEDTTTLFVALVTPKGPVDKAYAVHSLSEFIEKFGELDYNKCGLAAFNVYNWLNNGGTVYVKRLFQGQYTCLGKLKETEYNEKYSADVLYYYDETTKEYKKAAGYDPAKIYFYSDVNASANIVLSQTQRGWWFWKSYSTNESISIGAKYPGDYYNNIHVEIIPSSTKTVDLNVYYHNPQTGRYTLLETYPRKTVKTLETSLEASEYIVISDYNGLFERDGTINGNINGTLKFDLKNGVAALPQDVLLENFWGVYNTDANKYSPVAGIINVNANDILGNPLETPVELILDAGYPLSVKEALFRFVNNKSTDAMAEKTAIRDDIVLILDSYTKFDYHKTPTSVLNDLSTYIGTEGYGTNVAVYDQYLTIEDAILTDRDIYVSPTYFLSKLLSYNDMHYGVQFPTAGITRGLLTDAKDINYNPTPDEKESLFKDRINYIEKTSREYAFMSQRTFDNSGNVETNFTALSFLNNARSVERMKHELTKIGRNYLFEFNDSVTLSQMSNALNKYMNEWVSNRTLSYANVVVNKNAYSDEAVDVSMNIRFTGTIEVISIDITIE